MCEQASVKYWVAAGQQGDSRASSCPPAGKQFCFSLQTHYGMSDGGGQDKVRQVQEQVRKNLIKIGEALMNPPAYEPNELL